MKSGLTSWRQELLTAMGIRSKDWEQDWNKTVVYCTLSSEELDRKFDDGYGGSQGSPFTLWTADRVYFPAVYDGLEWVESVPRNPCDEITDHIGGQ